MHRGSFPVVSATEVDSELDAELDDELDADPEDEFDSESVAPAVGVAVVVSAVPVAIAVSALVVSAAVVWPVVASAAVVSTAGPDASEELDSPCPATSELHAKDNAEHITIIRIDASIRPI
jgi:hypothetical protein